MSIATSSPSWARVVDRIHGGFPMPRSTELFAEIARSWQPAERQPWLVELGQRLAQTMPIVPLVAGDPHGLVERRVRGLRVWNGWFSIPELSLGDTETPLRHPGS